MFCSFRFVKPSATRWNFQDFVGERRRRPENGEDDRRPAALSVSGNRFSFVILDFLHLLLVRYFKESPNATTVDVDDAWNLVGCLDTHLKRIVFVLYHFIIHVVVLCFKPCT
ncbi:hypothetical protein Hdeb2414_s0828g00951561 [Helianthus debilis subsp. tardiflorus]